MTFSKQFPKSVDRSNYPKWVEIYLSEVEDKECEREAREDNVKLMKECIEDAKLMMKEKQLNDYQSDMIKLAISLFEKRASHVVHFKENKAKEKFDKLHKAGF